MTVTDLTDTNFETFLDENKKLIRQQLASINVHRAELDAMLEAYEKSVRSHNEFRPYGT